MPYLNTLILVWMKHTLLRQCSLSLLDHNPKQKLTIPPFTPPCSSSTSPLYLLSPIASLVQALSFYILTDTMASLSGNWVMHTFVIKLIGLEILPHFQSWFCCWLALIIQKLLTFLSFNGGGGKNRNSLRKILRGLHEIMWVKITLKSRVPPAYWWK